MILDNKKLLKDFTKHFNSRLSSLDFVLKIGMLTNIGKNGYRPKVKQELRLPINDIVIFNQLKKANYNSLLEIIIKELKIENEFSDVFLSEMDKEWLSLFNDFIKKEIKEIIVKYNQDDISIITSDMMSDFLLFPISQFHTEITETYKQFNQYIAITGTPDNFFLNANTANSFSYFIQIWVAENLNISLNPHSNIIVT